MKPVIIIVVAFVLLIPVNVFAQESQTCEDFDVEKFTFEITDLLILGIPVFFYGY